MNGMEIMLKSMGLGDAMKGVDQLIKSGAIEKIIKFADEANDVNRLLASIETRLASLETCLRDIANERRNLASGSGPTDCASADAGVL